MRRLINKIACFIYFKTINESTLQDAMERMRKTLVDRGDTCIMCEARKPLRGEKMCGACYESISIKAMNERNTIRPDEHLPSMWGSK
jgi:hypothetical protein